MNTDEDNTKPSSRENTDHTAADLVRAKISHLYTDEPSAKEEQAEVKAMPKAAMSKHQLYMQNLSNSGRSLAEIQIAWHEYYAELPDNEKHEVWQEFYSEHERAREAHKKSHDKPEKPAKSAPAKVPVSNNTAALKKKRRRKSALPQPDMQTAHDVKDELLSRIKSQSAVHKNPHVRSLAFGLSMGLVTVFFLLFGFFNERFITPFIRPNSSVSATPIIVDPSTNGPVGPEAKIIIPKINVEAPVVYDVATIQEDDIQKGLERGVVHYPNTPNPGEKGNAVIFGHSSSNILNKGKYKFAFILLKSLEKDDTFIIQKDGKRYVYKIYNKFVTNPQDFSVVTANDKVSSMTLITCDPPGTSTNRLIIQAEQIFPNPATNAESSVGQTTLPEQPKQLPSNSPTLWGRLTGWL